MNQEPEFDDILNAMAQTLDTDLEAEQAQHSIPRTWRDLQRLSQTKDTPRHAVHRLQLAEERAVRDNTKA